MWNLDLNNIHSDHNPCVFIPGVLIYTQTHRSCIMELNIDSLIYSFHKQLLITDSRPDLPMGTVDMKTNIIQLLSSKGVTVDIENNGKIWVRFVVYPIVLYQYQSPGFGNFARILEDVYITGSCVRASGNSLNYFCIFSVSLKLFQKKVNKITV